MELLCFQESCRHVIEYLFPESPPGCTDKAYFYRNSSTMAALKSGRAFHSPAWLVLFSGSRAEGLHLVAGQGPEKSDRDYMYLYGGIWGTHVASGCGRIESDTSAFVMDQSQSPPGYCRVRLTNAEESAIRGMARTLVRRRIGIRRRSLLWTLFSCGMMLFVCTTVHILCALSPSLPFDTVPHFFGAFGVTIVLFLFVFVITILISIPFLIALCGILSLYSVLCHIGELPVFHTILKRFQIGTKKSKKCIVNDCGDYFLHPQAILKVLYDTRLDKTYQRPAQICGDWDLVTALICSAPFPWITRYVYQPRSSRWPSKEALEDIRILPGLLVPVGKKSSVDCDLQWRQSCSLLELRLAQDMPDWVKAAFRAVKATMKLIKKETEDHDSSGKTGASDICSFHMKTVLLWLLEESTTRQHMCSFRLMVRILVRLDHHLETGHLPHYFNPEYNLLDNVGDEELELARYYVNFILRDHVDAMIKASVKAEIGLSRSLGKNIDYWFSPKSYLSSVHSKFQAALVSASDVEYIV